MKILSDHTYYVVSICFMVLQTISSHKDDLIVTVKEGKLRGVAANLVDGARYYSFKGIPYAAPPVGKLRFKVEPKAHNSSGVITIRALNQLLPFEHMLPQACGIVGYAELCERIDPLALRRYIVSLCFLYRIYDGDSSEELFDLNPAADFKFAYNRLQCHPLSGFVAPLPPQPWKGIRDASNFGTICTQYNLTYQGGEDCLFLNVYTKSLHRNAKISVMVYIHGGSYYEGSGDFYVGDFLMQHDVILVTLNYRLELLGFLSLEIPEAPGNAGMKDQVAALRWIKYNIKKFGGDPNSVTIFGESAGATSVTYHMLSPMSRGLFHKVIAQSGVCISDWAIAQGAKARGFRAGKILGKETNDVHELYKFFMSLDSNQLTNLTFSTLTDDERYRGLHEQFTPVVEMKFPNVEPFITEHPVKMLVEGKISRVPLMVGYNSAEGLYLIRYQVSNLDVYNNKPSFYIPREAVNKVSADKLREFGDRIKRFYVGNNNMTVNDLNIIVDMQTDMHISYNSHRFSNIYASVSKSVYMYRFNFVTDLNIMKIALGLSRLKGVSHIDDIFYLFYNFLNENPYKNQQNLRKIIYKVTKLWTDFAKTGCPTPDNDVGENWEPYTVNGKEYYNIDDSFSLGYYADKKRIEFWNKIYAEAGLPHIS